MAVMAMVWMLTIMMFRKTGNEDVDDDRDQSVRVQGRERGQEGHVFCGDIIVLGNILSSMSV